MVYVPWACHTKRKKESRGDVKRAIAAKIEAREDGCLRCRDQNKTPFPPHDHVIGNEITLDRPGYQFEIPQANPEMLSLEQPHFVENAVTIRRVSYASAPDTTQRIKSVSSSLSLGPGVDHPQKDQLPLGGKRDSTAAAWNPAELQVTGGGEVARLSIDSRSMSVAQSSSQLHRTPPLPVRRPCTDQGDAQPISPKTPFPPPSAAYSVDGAVIGVAEKIVAGHRLPNISTPSSSEEPSPAEITKQSTTSQSDPTDLGFEGKGVFDAWPGFDPVRGIHPNHIRTRIAQRP